MIQKNLDKNLLILVDSHGDANEGSNTQNQASLLQFLIAYLKPNYDVVNKTHEYGGTEKAWHCQLIEQRREEFFKICLTL